MLLDRLIIKGNEIKEPGLFGKTVYVIKGNEIKEPGFLGKTVYVIKGDEIHEPGFLGKTLYVIKGNEIRTPGWFGQTVAQTKDDGTIKYYKPKAPTKKAPNDDSDSQPSKQIDRQQELPVIEESLDELQQHLESEQGCAVDYSNCNPEKKTYTVPQKYKKLQAIAPALKLETIKIHADIALIVAKNVRVLKGFVVDEANRYYSEENGVLYNKAKTVLVRVPLGYDISTLTIPNTVKIIGESAFSGCTMGAFTVPSTITSIGNGAFAYCKKFKSIFIPKTVISIGKGAFELDNSVQIMTDAESRPSKWDIDESQHKPIKWGCQEE